MEMTMGLAALGERGFGGESTLSISLRDHLAQKLRLYVGGLFLVVTFGGMVLLKIIVSYAVDEGFEKKHAQFNAMGIQLAEEHLVGILERLRLAEGAERDLLIEEIVSERDDYDESLRRLQALLYGLHVGEVPWVVAHDRFDGGGVVAIGERRLFLYRVSRDSPFQGTTAWWLAPGDKLNQNDAGWILRRGEQQHAFDTATRSFTVNPRLESATGFDTYWYIWSLTNPHTQIAAAAH